MIRIRVEIKEDPYDNLWIRVKDTNTEFKIEKHDGEAYYGINTRIGIVRYTAEEIRSHIRIGGWIVINNKNE